MKTKCISKLKMTDKFELSFKQFSTLSGERESESTKDTEGYTPEEDDEEDDDNEWNYYW